jgi:4-hydroxybenzoate polyprenyltransferase
MSKLNCPLYVDLDGTFIKSDMLLETTIAVLKKQPYLLFFLLFWVLKGKSYLKYKLASIADINVSHIPINQDTYNFLKTQKEQGRKIVLATASNETVARKFVAIYSVFDTFIASTITHNLKGKNKLDAIIQESTSFAYMGNSAEDYILFEIAEESYLVNPTNRAKKLNTGKVNFDGLFDSDKPRSKLEAWIKQLRIHQWIKNTLLFVPILVSNQFMDASLVMTTLFGFVIFGVLASSTYILNDLVDLESDRAHARKCNRPLASCELSILQGSAVASILFIVSLIGAYLISFEFLLVLVVYLVITLSYSFKLKQYFAVDVIALASLYTIRIFAGAAILNLTISFWLLSFSMFVFLSLALVKRCAELVALKETKKEQLDGRDYNIGDLSVFTSFGTSSSLLAILMYCFYMNSEVLSNQYQEPDLLWLSLPACGYWLMRMWVKTLRGEMHDDPIVYSLKDKGSLISISIMLVMTLLAFIS